KRVSFAHDTKPDPSASPAVPSETAQPEHIDGVIGQLEMHRSGAVKMRLANDIILDITPGTQPSFLQQAVHIDPTNKRLHVLGEISRRFVATPDLDVLLEVMAQADAVAAAAASAELEGLIPMDTT
ncbi:RNA polymerase III RPC4-domain-containing protein, partial [Vararia minispora EC-137]